MSNGVLWSLKYDVWLNKPPIEIDVYWTTPGVPETRDSAGRYTYTVVVRQGGEVIFPIGQLYCGCWDGPGTPGATEHITSLVAMKPGDTDADYFHDYTPEQRAWALENGEMLSLEASILADQLGRH